MLRSAPVQVVRRFAPLLVLVAVLTTACSSVGESPAASVNGTDISADSVQDELKAIRSHGGYREALEQQYGEELAGTGTGTVNADFTAQVLSLRVYFSLLEQSLAARDASPTSEEVATARENVERQLETLGGRALDAEYVDRLARQDALVARAQQEAVTGDIGKAYFAEHEDEFAETCLSHILVATETRSDAEASEIAGQLKRELDDGADFAAVAAASSDDPGSGAGGGDLGCGSLSQYVAEFAQAAAAQPVGVVGDPVKTQFGYHLILVRSRSAGSLADASEQLQQQVFSGYLLDLTCGAETKVSVNPRFGRWDRSTCKDSTGLARVTAPTRPAIDEP